MKRSPRPALLILAGAVLLPFLATAQIRINEVMASNTRAFPDVVDFEDYPDWLELHNAGLTAASLDGYYLSDDPSEPFKWRIPSGHVLPAGGFMVIVADGHDSDIGQPHPRGYYPWRNFNTERLHTNFSLSSDGESVVLSRVPDQQNDSLVALGSDWKYLDDGSAQNDDWKARLFDDSAWASGPAPLGYGDDPATVMSYGPDDNDRHITSYLRHSFELGDPANIASLEVTMQVDDSCLIFLNGTEILRHNLPEGPITSETRSLTSAAPPFEDDFLTFSLSALPLVAGTNSLAIEVHQNGSTSADMRLDLQLEALLRGSLIPVDSITFGTQVTDVSLGRGANNPNTWYQLAEATPGAANGSRVVNDLRLTSPDVSISPASGLYAGPQMITLSAPTGEIYYTIDGANPSTASTRYSAPFQVAETTVVRARCFDPGKVPSAILSRTFFIGEALKNLPFVSVTADPRTLFDDTIGIYFNKHERDGDVYKGKDAPGHLEFFPNDGSKGFAVNGGIRIGGENNWRGRPQKALNFGLKGKYGDDAIKYDLFPESGIPLHTGISLREGGDNWRNAMLRDSLWWYLAADGRLDVETSARRPTVAFLNGEYWGIYNIRDRWDEQWFFQHYGVDDGNYDHLGYGHFTSSSTTLGAQHGDLEEWNLLYHFISTRDLTSTENWAYVESRIDLDSFMDFVICESYGSNVAWRHNREFWKDRKPGAKWRWFVPDMDRTWQTGNANKNILNAMLGNDEVLVRLKANASFRERLAQRFVAHAYSTFAPARVIPMVDGLGALLDQELDRQVARWDGAATTRARYYAQIEDIKSFAILRPDLLIPEITSGLGVGNAVNLDLAVTGQGTIRLAGVAVPAGQMKIFPGIATAIAAEPAPGFIFSHWSGIADPAATEFTATDNFTLTANFLADGSTVTGGTLATNTTWTTAGSPYVIADDLIVPNGVALTIQEGVEVRLSSGRNIRVKGTLKVNGTEAKKVTFIGRAGGTWGGLSFEKTTTPSSLTHLVVRDATRGHDATIYPSAISGLDATVTMDFLDLDDCRRGPLFFRGGSMTLRDSAIHIPITGDGVNVKQGMATTERCTFLGNNSPDTDAIDYDGVVNGIIRECRIYRFLGFNSDGIDIGEQCQNVLIEGNRIFYNSDKGVSVGQGSSVVMRKNLIVGCPLGVGVKDSGSTILVDQNTFVNCAEGVSVYEKNFGNGGGAAQLTNNIFSNCTMPILADSLSSLTVSFSLSDSAFMTGPGNLNTDPQFLDPLSLDFGLSQNSPAIDSGDPGHANDPDGSRVDMGAGYQFNPDDYPFEDLNTVVINEVRANSEAGEDWLELHNRTNGPIDIGGWFLSDDGSNLAKYRIAEGTILGAGGYLSFFEDIHFGTASLDPNSLVPFALSAAGETLHLSSAVENTLTGYRFSENYGASFPDETLGYYFKPSTGTYNFVRLNTPTRGGPNSAPKSGPIIISEIMYNVDGNEDAEYLELLNISDAPLNLYESEPNLGWSLSKGIDFTFPSGAAMAAGERLIVTRNAAAFASTFNAPVGTQIFQWTKGKLSNSGDTVQLNQPGPINNDFEVDPVRIDRVNYGTSAPWTEDADGTGLSLVKIAENSYGNDAANWTAGAPSPGRIISNETYETWAAGLAPDGDEDADGFSNLTEYALGRDPRSFDTAPGFGISYGRSSVALMLQVPLDRTDVSLTMEFSPDLRVWSELELPPTQISGRIQNRAATLPRETADGFYRILVRKK